MSEKCPYIKHGAHDSKTCPFCNSPERLAVCSRCKGTRLWHGVKCMKCSNHGARKVCEDCKLPRFHDIEDINYNGPVCRCADPERPAAEPREWPQVYLGEWVSPLKSAPKPKPSPHLSHSINGHFNAKPEAAQAREWWIVLDCKSGKIDEGAKSPYTLVADTQECVHVVEASALEAARAEADHWRKKYGGYVDKWNDENRKLAEARERIAELEHERKIDRDWVNEARNDCNAALARVKELESQVEKFKDEWAPQNLWVKARMTELAEAQKQIEKLERMAASHYMSETMYLDAIRELTKESEVARARVKELEGILAEADPLIPKALMVPGLLEERDAAQARVTTLTGENVRLAWEQQDVRAKLTKAKARFEEIDKRIGTGRTGDEVAVGYIVRDALKEMGEG